MRNELVIQLTRLKGMFLNIEAKELSRRGIKRQPYKGLALYVQRESLKSNVFYCFMDVLVSAILPHPTQRLPYRGALRSVHRCHSKILASIPRLSVGWNRWVTSIRRPSSCALFRSSWRGRT